MPKKPKRPTPTSASRAIGPFLDEASDGSTQIATAEAQVTAEGHVLLTVRLTTAPRVPGARRRRGLYAPSLAPHPRGEAPTA